MHLNEKIMIYRKILNLFVLMTSTTFFVAQSQKPEYNNNFESYENGTVLTEPGVKKRLFTWGKGTTFTSIKSDGKGNKGSNGYAESTSNEGVYCVKYFTLEAGTTYKWKIAVKIEGDVPSFKRKYSLKVSSGKGDKSFKYIDLSIDDPESGKWIEHNNEFTVKEGYEKLNVLVYRWGGDNKVCIDDFVVKKKN